MFPIIGENLVLGGRGNEEIKCPDCLEFLCLSFLKCTVSAESASLIRPLLAVVGELGASGGGIWVPEQRGGQTESRDRETFTGILRRLWLLVGALPLPPPYCDYCEIFAHPPASHSISSFSYWVSPSILMLLFFPFLNPPEAPGEHYPSPQFLVLHSRGSLCPPPLFPSQFLHADFSSAWNLSLVETSHTSRFLTANTALKLSGMRLNPEPSDLLLCARCSPCGPRSSLLTHHTLPHMAGWPSGAHPGPWIAS